MVTPNRRLTRSLATLIASALVLICLSGWGSVAHASAKPEYTICSSTFTKTLDSRTSSNSAYSITASIIGYYDSHLPSTFCGPLYGQVHLSQNPYTVGGTLNITVFYNGTQSSAPYNTSDAGPGGSFPFSFTSYVNATCASATGSFYPRTGGGLIADIGEVCG